LKAFKYEVIDPSFDNEVIRRFNNRKEALWFVEASQGGLMLIKNSDYVEPVIESDYEKASRECGECLL
jgi:hypothetical protein